MNYGFVIIPILAALLVSCSGSKPSASTPVDTGNVKGPEIETKQQSAENKKQFSNGDLCKHCDYIYTAHDQQGNIIESEMLHGYKNGEEREYHDDKIVRISNFVEGGKKGMEYSFSDGKIVDSVYTETTSGGKWNFADLQKAIPAPIFNYILDLFYGKPSDVFAFTTHNGKITVIYKKDYSSITRKIPIVATIDYESPDDFSSFKLTIKSPFYEERTYKDDELVYQKIIKDGHTLLEFKKGEFVKQYYDDGAIYKILTGNVSYQAGDGTDEYTGTFLSQEFFENGDLKSELAYEDGKWKKHKIWNNQKVLTFSADFPTNVFWYYDNGMVQMEWQGEITDNLEIINGTSVFIYPNGIKKFEEKYENGKLASRTLWKESGKIQSEYFPMKYAKIYDENEKLSQEQEGDVRIENGNTIALSNGIIKNWRPDGTLEQKTTLSDGIIVAQQLWDSTGLLAFDYERAKHLKWTTNTIPETRTELLGNIIFENNNLSITGNSIEKGYSGKKLIYEYHNEEYMPTLKSYKKTTAYAYDSAGQKTMEKITRFGITTLLKQWSKQTPLSQDYFLSVDYNAQSHLKIYSEPKKLKMSYKGTSEWVDQLPTYIDGTATHYFTNGKTQTITTWKDRNVVSSKTWTEDGSLYIDFISEKHLKFFSADTKKLTMHFKGKSQFRNGVFDFVSGVAKFFDENGKETKTEVYKDAEKVPADNGNL